MIRINTPGTKHLYQLTVQHHEYLSKEKPSGEPFQIQIEANNRTQASRIAVASDYYPHDCNMIG